MKSGRMIVIVSLGALVPIALWLVAPQRTVHAETTTPVFTMSATGNTSGVIIVDQSSGAITFCTSLVNASSGRPSDSCTLLGRAAPTSGSSNSLTVTAAGASVYILNNISGQIVQCGTFDNVEGGVGKPEGSCVTLASANR